MSQSPYPRNRKKTMHKDLVSIDDLEPEEIFELLESGLELKKKRALGIVEPVLQGRTVVMIFEKPSLRTRVTFEVGITQLGGQAIYLQGSDIGLGHRESIADIARNLERWVDGIVARASSHQTVVELARWADTPVINGLTDREHPCQALALAMTLREKKCDLRGLKFAFIGDGNNVAHSFMLLSPKAGMDFVIACPEGYEPDKQITEQTKDLAARFGTSFSIVRDPFEAVKDADVVYTDVWVSMGQESEAVEREKAFRSYQVNRELIDSAEREVLISHCLPAHRGQEITDEVLDGPGSIALDEAENRLHIQKAVMARLFA